MKAVLITLAFLFVLPVSLLAGPADTAINGVNVQFINGPSIFPEAWLQAPINAHGEHIDPQEIPRTCLVVIKALNKYPHDLLAKTLHAVFFLKSMDFYNVGFGGTNSTDAVYVINNNVVNGFTNDYIEQTFHHEFSSVLFRDYPALLDTVAWKMANIPGFDYNDPEEGVGAIRNKQSSQVLDTALCRKGFITQYACSSLENDINTLAQNIFRPARGFWYIVDHYPRIRQKTTLLIAFYGRLNNIFTETFFRKLDIP